ncbi:MAG TPA: NAD(+)/NADH kinase [Dehalococcoidia bacterium]|nr:NAD(+)/NADH kinase [Dehalococcoidia bacterium]
MNKIGIFYNPRREEAISYSKDLAKLLTGKKIEVWLHSAWEPQKARPDIPGSHLIISIGGDGTILRAAKAIIPHQVPILGINLGKLGFMSEITVAETRTSLNSILKGEGWIEQRAMLEIKLQQRTLYALNDVFIGRRSSARLVTLECEINGTPLTTFRADGMIIATASGSTGYALACGGPILDPQSKNIILQPVAPHFSFDKPMVLPARTKIGFRIITTHEAMTSIDGQVESELHSGDRVKIQLSRYISNFLRLQPKSYYYGTLDLKINRKIS